METLQLKHICGYLPYGLKIDTPNGINILKGIDTVFGTNGMCYWVNGLKKTSFFIDCKPLLRPLSSLTKEIEHNGERFVPLIKLCDEFRSNIYWTDNGSISIIECPIFKGNKVVSHDSYECFMTLGYHEEYKMFYGCNDYDSELNIPNQLEMYNRLFEWHFDIHGLIDKNLAINLEEI